VVRGLEGGGGGGMGAMGAIGEGWAERAIKQNDTVRFLFLPDQSEQATEPLLPLKPAP
jgi:hypothetical protein